MLSLVASLAIVFSGGADPQLDAKETAAWTKVQPSIVIVSQRGARRGTAALVDSRGYFITGNSVVGGAQSLEGQFFDGQRITLFVVSVDGPSQLALLKTGDPFGERSPLPLFVPGDQLINADHPLTIIAALPAGPISAELVNTKTVALLASQKSMAMFSEIHFELPMSKVAGDPVFTLDGQLAGVLQATLNDNTTAPFATSAVESAGAARAGGPLGLKGAMGGKMPVGPNRMVVAYSPVPQTMKRVLDGFLTPNHEVQRPAIGVYCRDSNGAGALIDSVMPESPAAASGLKKGDVIIAIEGSMIHGQLDFARVMLQQTVGSNITVTVRRESRLMNFGVRVGM